MQRFFSTFPGSWPGVGLLLLRGLVGGAAVTQGGLYLANGADSTAATFVLGLLALASGAILIVGFLTPAAGPVAGLTTLVIAVTCAPSSSSSLLIDGVAAFFVTADAAALALLGPGAHSMDAYLFGRREIIIPHVPYHR